MQQNYRIADLGVQLMNYSITSIPKNAVLGASFTFFPGVLGTYLVRAVQGNPYFSFSLKHPLIGCTKVMAITLPLWDLYKHFLEQHIPKPLRPAAFSVIFLSVTLGVSTWQITPLSALAFALTYISWRVFLETNLGKQLVLSQVEGKNLASEATI